jgi:hypothetical protein
MSLKMEALRSIEASGTITQRRSGASQMNFIFKSNYFSLTSHTRNDAEMTFLCASKTGLQKSDRQSLGFSGQPVCSLL